MSNTDTMPKRQLTDAYIKEEIMMEAIQALAFKGRWAAVTEEGDADYILELLNKTQAHCCTDLEKEHISHNGVGAWVITGKPLGS